MEAHVPGGRTRRLPSSLAVLTLILLAASLIVPGGTAAERGASQGSKGAPAGPSLTSGVGSGPVAASVIESLTPRPTQILNVLDYGVVGDGVTDDRAAIQWLVDAAPMGAAIYFPDVAPGHYRLSGSVILHKPVAVVGDGAGSGSEIRQTKTGAELFEIRKSGIRIQGLRLIGPGYRGYFSEHAVLAEMPPSEPIRDITITGNRMQGWGGSAIRLSHVADFVVSGNHLEDSTYAGVLIISGARGLIVDNLIRDVGNPETGAPLANAYGIVVTAIPGSPYSREVLVARNTVIGNPLWTGIHNHGGHRILIDSNAVHDVSVAYANTRVRGSGIPSDDTMFVNNLAVNAPLNAMWLSGASDNPTDSSRAVGNQFVHAGPIWAYGLTNPVIAWNSAANRIGTGETLVTNRAVTGLALAHNGWPDDSVSHRGPLLTFAESASPPPAPVGLRADEVDDAVVLRWRLDPSIVHDGFAIEYRPANGPWTKLAIRPPNEEAWNFSVDAGGQRRTVDPLRYVARGFETGTRYEFRIRTLRGSAVSAWSDTANV